MVTMLALLTRNHEVTMCGQLYWHSAGTRLNAV